jgi:O-antigen/teichoic acid export membrane protein
MGPEFVAGAPVLVILASSQLINMYTGSTGFLLAVRGHPGLGLLNVTVAWGTSAALTVALAPQYGALGAAIGYFVAMIVIMTLEAVECRLVFGFFQVSKSILAPTLVLFLFGGAAIGLRLIYPWTLLETMILSAALLSCYALAIWRFALQPVDIAAFKGLVSGFRQPRAATAAGQEVVGE